MTDRVEACAECGRSDDDDRPPRWVVYLCMAYASVWGFAAGVVFGYLTWGA